MAAGQRSDGRFPTLPTMLLARDLEGPVLGPATVVTIGAFDGLHIGHQVLLAHVLERAAELECRSAMVSFEPLPRERLSGAPLLRLLKAAAKIRLLDQLGLDQLLLLRFNARLMALEPAQFVEQVLVQRLHAREVWVGPNFRFGRRRSGDIHTLERLGAEHGFAVQVCQPAHFADQVVSATAVRAALGAGDFLTARQMLGRPFRFSGRVVRGRQLGRSLGFPTANLHWPSPAEVFSGIYAVRVNGHGLHHHPAIASLGTRPTVGGVEPLLEVHLFDFDGDLYGQRLEVEFVAWQRSEQRFDSLDALVTQMHADCAEARQLLG